MRRKSFVRMVVGIVATVAVTLMLGSSALAQVKYKTLQKFNALCGRGCGPIAGVIFDAAGNLYGTTPTGGKGWKRGVVFELTPTAKGPWTEKLIQPDFNDRGTPLAGLTFDAAGNLYGTESRGGWWRNGAVFQMVPNSDGSWAFNWIHSFGGREGAYPAAVVIFDAAGNLYSTTSGGDCFEGCSSNNVFELFPNSDGDWKESVLYPFTDGSDGGPPSGSLVFDPIGNIYGATSQGGDMSACGGNGCGVIYKLSPNLDGSWAESVLHRFSGNKDGAGPAGPVLDKSGNLYSTTSSGGAYGYGNVFKLTPNSDGTWTEHVLHQFGGKEGSNPFAGLIFDNSGNLYGTASHGGTYGYGVVFKMIPTASGGWKYQTLFNFDNAPSAYPYAGLTLDSAGNLYGTTGGDGSKTFGSVFEITP